MSELREKRARLWGRAADEWYQEPPSATCALLQVERFPGGVLDPACGGGNIVRAMLAAGVPASGTDLRRRVTRAPWFIETRDFLDPTYPWRAPNIVCNPPFGGAKLAEAFIRRALELRPRKVAMFLDLCFLAGGKRGAGLWRERPPARVWILSDRPSCPPGAALAAGTVPLNERGEPKGGTADWCWMVWCADHEGPTQLGWIVREPEERGPGTRHRSNPGPPSGVGGDHPALVAPPSYGTAMVSGTPDLFGSPLDDG